MIIFNLKLIKIHNELKITLKNIPNLSHSVAAAQICNYIFLCSITIARRKFTELILILIYMILDCGRKLKKTHPPTLNPAPLLFSISLSLLPLQQLIMHFTVWSQEPDLLPTSQLTVRVRKMCVLPCVEYP